MKKIDLNPHFGEFLKFFGKSSWSLFETAYNIIVVGGVISTIFLAFVWIPAAVINGIIAIVFAMFFGEIISNHDRPKIPAGESFSNIP